MDVGKSTAYPEQLALGCGRKQLSLSRRKQGRGQGSSLVSASVAAEVPNLTPVGDEISPRCLR